MLVIGTAVLAALATVVALRVTAPPAATAESGQAEEVRASAFVLVGPDGKVLARLGPGPDGNGNLTVFDGTGALRVVVAGGGAIVIREGDGLTPRVTLAAIQGAAGIQLNDREGRPRLQVGVSAEAEGGAGYGVLYANGTSAIHLGDRPSLNLTGLRINDAEGNPLLTLP
jgi:hypothetical protein